VTGAIVSVQLPGPETGRLEKYHRTVAKGKKPQHIRAALESILADVTGEGSGKTLVVASVGKRRWNNKQKKEELGEAL